MQMSIAAFATSCGVPVRREGHHPISCQDLIACCTSGGRPTNTPPSTRLAAPKMTPGLSEFTVIPRLARATPYFYERVIRCDNVLIVVNANLRDAFCQLYF